MRIKTELLNTETMQIGQLVWHNAYGKLTISGWSESKKTITGLSDTCQVRYFSPENAELFEEREARELSQDQKQADREAKKLQKREDNRQARLLQRANQEGAGLPVFYIHDEFIGNGFDPLADVDASAIIERYASQHAHQYVYASPSTEAKAITQLVNLTGWSADEVKPYIHVGRATDVDEQTGKLVSEAHDIKINCVLPNSSELDGLDERLLTNFGYSDWRSVPNEMSIAELQINKTSFNEWLIRETKGALLHNFEEESSE